MIIFSYLCNRTWMWMWQKNENTERNIRMLLAQNSLASFFLKNVIVVARERVVVKVPAYGLIHAKLFIQSKELMCFSYVDSTLQRKNSATYAAQRCCSFFVSHTQTALLIISCANTVILHTITLNKLHMQTSNSMQKLVPLVSFCNSLPA